MKRAFTLLIALSFSINGFSQNQQIGNQSPIQAPQGNSKTSTQSAQPRNCATMDVLEQQLAKEGKTVTQFKQEVEQRLKQNPSVRNKAVVTIPVIVHVIHNGTSVGSGINISAAQIQSQIDVLNEDFRRLNADTVNTPSGFQSVAADPEIEFCLATLDPNGNTLSSPGINRVNRNNQGWSAPPYTTSYIDGTIKPATIWNRNDYLNIWVTDISGGILGYAQFPGGSSNTDGVVIGYQYFGSSEKGSFPVLQSPYDEGRTTTHEIGHFFALYHIWGDDGGACTGSDQVSDTPNQGGATSGCPSSPSSCSSTDMVENYMDYSYDACMNIFTQGQKSRMLNAISSYSYRQSLTTSNKCQTSFTANFTANQTTVLVGNSVNFTDLTNGSPNSWSWTFQGGTPSSSSVQNPSNIVYNTPGCYDVTLIASDGTNTDTATQTCYITATNSINACDTAFWIEGGSYYVQPTDSSGFSLNLIDNDNKAVAPTLASYGINTQWQVYSETVGSDTNLYLGATSWFDTTGTADNWIIFGPLTIKSSGADLKWDHKFQDNNYRDGYEVLINTATQGGTISDFNSTGTVLLDYSDNDTATNNHTTWTPRALNIDSSTYGGSQVYIAYHHDAYDQYLLYFDNIRVEQCSTVTVTSVTEQQFSNIKIYPNPTNKMLNVELPASNSNMTVKVLNMMGKTVFARDVRPETGQKMQVNLGNQSDGIYIVQVIGEDRVMTKKVLLTR